MRAWGTCIGRGHVCTCTMACLHTHRVLMYGSRACLYHTTTTTPLCLLLPYVAFCYIQGLVKSWKRYGF